MQIQENPSSLIVEENHQLYAETHSQFKKLSQNERGFHRAREIGVIQSLTACTEMYD